MGLGVRSVGKRMRSATQESLLGTTTVADYVKAKDSVYRMKYEAHDITIEAKDGETVISCSCGWSETIKQGVLSGRAIGLKHISNIKRGKLL